MSDNRKNRKYSKPKEFKKPVILAKRETNSKNDKNFTTSKSDDQNQIQPKILLKSKEKEQTAFESSSYAATHERDESSSTPSATATQCSPNTTSVQLKDKEINKPPPPQANEQLIAPIPIMTTSPILLLSSLNHQINLGASKVLQKLNNDFFVVGVVGQQSVGKSTIMNLLAAENFSTFKRKFLEKDEIFSTKFKMGKISSLPRTDAVHMFITKERMILLDCPPVLCNSYKRDVTTNELDDMQLIILLLNVCHLIIVVQNDNFNLNLLRLIQFAELTKTNQDTNTKTFDNINTTYLPHIIFVKNKAKHYDFLLDEKLKIEKLLKLFFKDSNLKIFLEEYDKNKRKQQFEINKRVNYFVFPEITDCGAGDVASYHPNLETLFVQIRNRVFMSPRNLMYNGTAELTESLWFDLVTTTILNKNQFFLNLYEEIRRSSKDSKCDNVEEV